jgi:hypothetical protein
MKKLKRIDGSCAVVALHYVSGIEEDAVLRSCIFHGFRAGQGMEDEEWQAAAGDLGIKFRAVAAKSQRLKSFVKKHPKGLYLLGTKDHIFVLDNGIIIDPREKQAGRYPGLGRIIKQAWKVKS